MSAQSSARVPVRGVLYYFATLFLFGVLEALVKHLVTIYPVPQIVWARFFFHSVLVLVAMLPYGIARTMRTRRPGLQLFRLLLQLMATMCMFFALTFIPLAEAVSIVYLSPLIVTALSAAVLGERVGPRRWAAVAVGFIGVLVVMRPGAGVMHWATLLVLLTAFSYALFQISTRILGTSDSPLTTLVYTAVVGTVVTTPAVPFFWTAPTPTGWLLLASVGLIAGAAHFSLINALKQASASSLQPFSYLHIVWSSLLGFLVFGNIPTLWTFIGAALIVGGGLFVFYRESSIRQRVG